MLKLFVVVALVVVCACSKNPVSATVINQGKDGESLTKIVVQRDTLNMVDYRIYFVMDSSYYKTFQGLLLMPDIAVIQPRWYDSTKIDTLWTKIKSVKLSNRGLYTQFNQARTVILVDSLPNNISINFRYPLFLIYGFKK